jgi:hypothetical protein
LNAAPFTHAGEAEPEKTTEEKPKEPPLKYSAWCAFRELSDRVPPPVKDDPETRHTRPTSVQWKGFGRRGKWANVILELKNTTEETVYKGSASIQLDPVRANQAGIVFYKTSYKQDFEVGPLTTKQYNFSVLCPEDGWADSLRIRITANGGTYEDRDVYLHDLDGQDFVVVVSEASGAFLYLSNVRRTVPTGDEIEPPKTERDRLVAVVEPADVPSRWHDLMLANLIIIDGPPREKLTTAQVDALRSYVQAGGQLLITAGKDPSRLKGPIEDLAGITVGEMTEIESIDSIEPPFAPNTADWKLPIVEARVDPAVRGQMDRRYNKKTNVLEMSRRYYGSGSVTFLPFSLNDPRLATWTGGRKDLPLSILSSVQGRRLFEQEGDAKSLDLQDEDLVVRSPIRNRNIRAQGDMAMTGATDLPGFRHNLDQSFRMDTPVQPQKPETVLSFLLLYFLCVVPVNYLLFGWLKRREVAWLAVPVWAAAFTVIAYVVGYMGQTGMLTINQVSIIEAAPGEGVGMTRTYMALYAPYRDEYRLRFPVQESPDGKFDVQAAPGHLLDMSRSESRVDDQPQMSIIDGDSGIGIDRLLVQQRSTRQLEVIHRVNLGDGIDVKLKRRPQPGRYNVFDLEVTNSTPYDLYYPAFIYEGQAVEITEDDVLAAGASRKLEGVGSNQLLPWKESGAVFYGKQIIFRKVRGPHAANRVVAVNNYVRDRISKMSSGCAVCAWVEAPVLPVTVASSNSEPQKPGQLEGITLLVVPVPLRESTPSAKQVPLTVRYAQTFEPEIAPVDWAPVKGPVPMRFVQNVGTEVYLELQVPKNHPQLKQDGFKLRLNARLAGENNRAGRVIDSDTSLTNGEIKIEVRRTLDSGNTVWDDITPTDADFRDIKSTKAWAVPTLDIEFDNHRIRVNDVIILKLTTRQRGQIRPLELRNVELKTTRD